MRINFISIACNNIINLRKLLVACLLCLSACSINPATGDRQFTALLPAANEAKIGAEEHIKIQQEFGTFMTGKVANYVNEIGQKVARDTERKDVQYKFYVIDSPIVNAFALPGGYIYVSRGLLTLANDESQLAAVLGHEIGHVTARHAAERMSHGTLIGLGASAIGIATGSQAIGQVASLGSNLYLTSYSRSQEHQSDELGVRYLSKSGYDPMAMSKFLRSLDAQSKLEAKEEGRESSSFNYFSTHPLTADRVTQASAEGQKYAPQNVKNRSRYLHMINGLTYGDSAEQGFARGNIFYHPTIGFRFSVPNGMTIKNSPSAVTAAHANGSFVAFDQGKDKGKSDPATYLSRIWLKGEKNTPIKQTTIHGMRAAMTSFDGTVNNRQVTIQLVAIEWAAGEFFRFQIATPRGVSQSFIASLQKTPLSFRRLSTAEKENVRPKRLIILEAPTGSTVQSMAAKMKIDGNKVEKFLVLNGMFSGEKIIASQPYKIVI